LGTDEAKPFVPKLHLLDEPKTDWEYKQLHTDCQ